MDSEMLGMVLGVILALLIVGYKPRRSDTYAFYNGKRIDKATYDDLKKRRLL